MVPIQQVPALMDLDGHLDAVAGNVGLQAFVLVERQVG